MEFGQKLREARMKAGLTQESVAGQVGVSRQTMSNWENDRSYPDLASVLKLSELYGLSVDEMLREDGNLRKKVEQRQENLKRYCSWTHDFGILLMPLAMVLAYFGKTETAVFTAVMGFLVFCLPHIVYVGRFRMPWKLAVLRILAVGLWLTGVMTRRIQEDFTAGGLFVFGGLSLQTFVNHRLDAFPGIISKRMTAFSGFVIALVLIFAFIPMATESMEKGEFNEAIPFDSREYRVAEVRHGDEENLPLVKLWRGNTAYITFPGQEEKRLAGFTYVTQPDNSPYKGVWEMIPEDAVHMRYKVAVEADGRVVFTGSNGTEILWEYVLEYAPMMGIQILDSLGLVTAKTQWFYEGFVQPGERVGAVPLRGEGELRLLYPDGPERIRVTEEYHKDGLTEYRELTLERDRKNCYVIERKADPEAGEEYSVFRIPYEEGEFVLCVGYTP